MCVIWCARGPARRDGGPDRAQRTTPDEALRFPEHQRVCYFRVKRKQRAASYETPVGEQPHEASRHLARNSLT